MCVGNANNADNTNTLVVVSSSMFQMNAVFFLLVFGCHYQCSRLPGKTHLWNDLLCECMPSAVLNSTHSLIRMVSSLYQHLWPLLHFRTITEHPAVSEVSRSTWQYRGRYGAVKNSVAALRCYQQSFTASCRSSRRRLLCHLGAHQGLRLRHSVYQGLQHTSCHLLLIIP